MQMAETSVHFPLEAYSQDSAQPMSCGPSLNRPSVLVVDDDPVVGRTLAHLAEECGCEAKLSISAASFRGEYEAATPALILLDLSLPGADGVELLRFLAKKNSQATVFIVSGFDRRVLEAAHRLGEALGLRMGDPLTKPLLITDLERAIRRANDITGPDEGGRHDTGVCLE
jgi:FixJ family two-component response regulator